MGLLASPLRVLAALTQGRGSRMRTSCWSLLTLIFLCASMAHAARTDPVAAFPAAAPVLAEVRGQDETDTLARQFATLELLRDALNTLAMPPRSNQLPPTALAKYREYGLASQRLWEALPPHYDATCKQGMANLNFLTGCDKTVLVQTISRYRGSPEFARGLLGRHLPPGDVNRFLATAPTLDRVAPTRTTALDRAAAGLSKPFRTAGLSEPFRIAGALALLSLVWLLPAALAYLWISNDRAETRTKRFSAWGSDGVYYNGKVEEPTGNINKGDPDFARFVALAWTLAFLPGIFCLLLIVQGDIHIAVKVAVCAALLFGVWKLVPALTEADGGMFGLLRRAWYGLLGIATLHLLAWMVYLAMVWLG